MIEITDEQATQLAKRLEPETLDKIRRGEPVSIAQAFAAVSHISAVRKKKAPWWKRVFKRKKHDA